MVDFSKMLLKRFFDIRDGEIRRTLYMQLDVFLITATLLIVKPTVNGLFLTEMGVESLPAAFVIVALFAAAISTLYARYLGRAPLQRIILITLVSSVALFILFGIFLNLNIVAGWILFAFYVVVALFAVLSASQFWILANVVFNAREAKRLFGFIGAGAIAGAIFGGYLTSFLAEPLGSENLVFVGAGLLSLCIPITSGIWHRYVLKTQSNFQRKKRIARTDHPLLLIRKSPHLMYLSGIIGVSVIVAKLVDYQFSAVASSVISDPDELTAFFGLWFSNFNVISLIIQLLLTRRIVGKLGIGKSLYFLPLSILFGALLMLFFPVLWVAIFIKTSDSGLKQSLNKSAVELLAMPIPSKIKNQTKTFIDVVIDSIATGIGGAILIFLVNGLDLSTQSISLMMLALIGLWIYFVSKVRLTYLKSFKANIQDTAKDSEGVLDLANESVLSDIVQLLQTGSERQILMLLIKIKSQPHMAFLDALIRLLNHPSDRIKEEAIRNLYLYKGTDLFDRMSSLTRHPLQEVKIAAFAYLIHYSDDERFELIDAALKGGDDRMRYAIYIAMAEESRDNLVLKRRFQLQKHLSQAFKDVDATRNEHKEKIGPKMAVLKAAGLAKIRSLYPMIESSFSDANPRVAGQALLAAGDTLDPYFIDALIQSLSDEAKAPYAQRALINYGEEIVGVLAKYSQDNPQELAIIHRFPSILEHFETQAAADLLFQLVKIDDEKIRMAALRSLNQLQIKHKYIRFQDKKVLPHILEESQMYRVTLSVFYAQKSTLNSKITEKKKQEIASLREDLIQLLEKNLDVNLERIFRLLGLKYPPEDVISVFQSIQSHQPQLRFNALEYLDNLLEPSLKKVLMPLVETASLDTISEEAIKMLNLKVPNEKECFAILLESDDENVRFVTRKLANALKVQV
jgi:AAA family ATP:ADP antiporter